MSITLKKGEYTPHRTNPTKKKGIPPGHDKNKHHKGHLLGAQFGGSNSDPENFVPLSKRTNTPDMRTLEGRIRKAVDVDGDTVEYTVTPNYTGSNLVPDSITLHAVNQNGKVIVSQTLPN